jgi:hypothetical protein
MRNRTVPGLASRAGDTASLRGSSKKALKRPASAGERAIWALALAALALGSAIVLSPWASARTADGGMAAQSAPSHASPDPAPPPDASARIIYTRTLPGSIPEYLAVVVNADGSGSYEGRPLKDTDQTRPLKLSAATTHRLFGLAAELDNFRVPLESHKKVADLGLKTFTYEQQGEKHEVEFNYTTRQTARDLTDLFERIAGVEEHLDTLQYALKYDPLSLPQELLHIQIDLEHKALADPELMVPELQQIANNPRLLHLAQVRAQDILRTVSGGQ